MIWKHSPTSQFNVKTAYHAKIAKLKRKNEESSHGSEGDKYWKILWKLNVPGFVKYFLWKACYDILPTKRNLCKKYVLQNLACPICNKEDEIALTALWVCPTTPDVTPVL